MIRVMVPIGCRSDEGLSAPIIRRMEQHPEFVVYTCRLEPRNYSLSYQVVSEWIGSLAPLPDLALIVGDRAEMLAAATACFHANIPIVHVYAGTTNSLATHDDIARHMISLMSDVQICESSHAAFTVANLLTSVRKQPDCHVAGITHLDDLEVDDSLVSAQKYDLVLYNPVTLGEDVDGRLQADISSIIYALDQGGRRAVLIGPNPDPMIGMAYESLLDRVDSYFANLPRPQFLGLLANCTRFVTNSSAAYYEAPHFLKPNQILMVGPRNLTRSQVNAVPGGSDRVIDEVVTYARSRRRV
jgi:UDP-N-acetylglucosamine 2-epimerase